jgi:hypothetical protein
VNYSLYGDLMDRYDGAEKRAREIQEEAARQRTQWEEVISIFNARFVVPFRLEAKNREAVMLGDEDIIELAFSYHERGSGEKPSMYSMSSSRFRPETNLTKKH